MTCSRDIRTEDSLEREFCSIRKVFRGLAENEKPLRIEWGTKKAFGLGTSESKARQIEERIRDHERLIEKSKGWKAESPAMEEAYDVFRAILEAEVGQLRWVIS
jgi:hypothetical protein